MKRFVQPGWVHACPTGTDAGAAIKDGEAKPGGGGCVRRDGGCVGVTANQFRAVRACVDDDLMLLAVRMLG